MVVVSFGVVVVFVLIVFRVVCLFFRFSRYKRTQAFMATINKPLWLLEAFNLNKP